MLCMMINYTLLFETPYMATGAKKRVQASFVGQLTEKLVKEMKKLERERSDYGVFGPRQAAAYRKFRFSKDLAELIIVHKLWYANWRCLISTYELEIKKRKEAEMRYRVLAHRENEIRKIRRLVEVITVRSLEMEGFGNYLEHGAIYATRGPTEVKIAYTLMAGLKKEC